MMEIKYAPLVLFVFNRPDHTFETLSYIGRLKNAENTDFYIFCDAPRGEKDLANVEKVRAIIREFAEQNVYHNTIIIEAEKNKGLATSIIEGVTDIINKYGSVIVMEDDLIASYDFLEYMNHCLSYYERSPKIWSISGYTFPLKSFETYKYDVYLSGRGCSWGWATWADRWNTVDWNVRDYNSFKFNIFKRYSFAKWGRDLPAMLDHYMVGNAKSWAIRWCYSEWKQKKYTIYPVDSRIKNIGTDGSGTNFQESSNRYDTEIKNDHPLPMLYDIDVDSRIRKDFQNKYVKGIDYLKSIIVTLLIRLKIRKR